MQRLPKLIERQKDILQIVSWTHILPILFAALILTPLTSPALPAQAKAEKVAICHVDGKGGYRLIHVAAKALDAHMGHGDARPGDPGFDENCAEVPILSPGCQAANTPLTAVTYDQPLLVGPGTFYAGETISVTVPDSERVELKIRHAAGDLYSNLYSNTVGEGATESYTLVAADVTEPIEIFVSSRVTVASYIFIRCE